MSETRASTSSARAFLEGLNPAQLEAVTHRGGHCLVLAGAGSGKTRVLTHRIAWLIADQSVDPAAICALTFTNKSAAEMRSRVRRLLDDREAGAAVWLSTFHSLGLRLLREWTGAGVPGLPPAGFAVYDRDASLAVWRRAQAALRVSPRDYDPAKLFNACSRAVNRLEDPGSWDDNAKSWERRVTGRIWQRYRAEMRAAGAVDFDDLMHLPLQALARDAELRRRTAGRFAHLLIDEYQDTNRIQYRLVKTLLGDGARLLVVGDEDQAIYRWRGAELDNVLDFQSDFPGATVVRLEQNYRSSQPILSAAGSLVANNRQRLGKQLWTDRPGGELPLFVQCATDREEAEWVAKKVEELAGFVGGSQPAGDVGGPAGDRGDTRAGTVEGGLLPGVGRAADGGGSQPAGDQQQPAPSDIAVLYRTNAQSRLFEEVFIRRRIPHRVVGGQRFFARREVRDVLAYLQLLVRDDDVALQRAISTPSRGIGPKTLEGLAGLDAHRSAAAALRALTASGEPERAFRAAGFSPAAAERLLAFGRLLTGLREVAVASSVGELIGVAIERTGYRQMLERDENTEDRLANLGELVAAAQEASGEESVDDEIATPLPAPVSEDQSGSGSAASMEEETAAAAVSAKVETVAGAVNVESDEEATARAVSAEEETESVRTDASLSAPHPGTEGRSVRRGTGLAPLRAFLDRLALLADADTDRRDADGVRLMTVHAAKGLEFDVVFLAGMEEELFPHATSIAEGDVEEERRLCYVGMTRARHRLLLSAARSRRINGRERWQEPSRFIGEIDPRQIEVRDYLAPGAVGSKDYAPSAFTGIGGRSGRRQRGRRSGAQAGRGGASAGSGPRGAPGGFGPRGSRSSQRGRTGRGGASSPAASPVKIAASQPTRPATELDLVEGATVVHPMFGPGRVLDATGSGDKLKLEIRFNEAGNKQVIAKFARLQIPDEEKH